jgi:hypothetical protein
MNAEAPETRQPEANNAEELSRLLDLELIQKRVEWQRTSARHKSLKTFSLLFLFIVVLAGLAAFYLVYIQASGGREQRPPAAATRR